MLSCKNDAKRYASCTSLSACVRGLVLVDMPFTTDDLKRFGTIVVLRGKYEKILTDVITSIAIFVP